MHESIEPIEFSPGVFDKFKTCDDLDKWIEMGFDKAMWGLGFEMDCFELFNKYLDDNNIVIKEKSKREEKRKVLYVLEHADRNNVGNYLFSYWRWLTHWAYSYDEYEVDFLKRIIKVLEDSYSK